MKKINWQMVAVFVGIISGILAIINNVKPAIDKVKTGFKA